MPATTKGVPTTPSTQILKQVCPVCQVTLLDVSSVLNAQGDTVELTQRHPHLPSCPLNATAS